MNFAYVLRARRAMNTLCRTIPVVRFEAPRRPEFGDIATNVAFSLAKSLKQPPPAIADAIAARALNDPRVRATVAAAAPSAGFINLRLAPEFWQRTVSAVLEQGADFGRGPARAERISLEFGSANPTGPLVVVQGRTLSVGDTLAKSLRFAGYDVFTEWIINDAGAQLDTLGRSLYARYRQLWEPAYPFPPDGYPGAYLTAIAGAVRAADGRALENGTASAVATVFFAIRARCKRARTASRRSPFRRCVRSLAKRTQLASIGSNRHRNQPAARTRRNVRKRRRGVGSHDAERR